MRAFNVLRVVLGMSFLAAGCGVPAAPIDGAGGSGDEVASAGASEPSGDAPLTIKVDNTLAAPRPLAPAGGATVTANRPTFKWSLGQGLLGARLQICKDRECNYIEQEVEIHGDSGKPKRALLPGVHFYRVLGVSGQAHGAVASAPRPFTVRRLSSMVDTSWGSTPDFDSDGFADVALTSRRTAAGGDGAVVDPPRIMVYAGRMLGIPLAPTTTIDAAPGAEPTTPYWIANGGDIDGDGFTDLLLGVAGDAGAGRVDIYRGSKDGLGATPAFVLKSVSLAPSFAVRGAGVGDVDGDGLGDIAVLEDAPSGGGNRLVIYYGRANGAPSPGTTIVSAAGEPFGAVAPAGDVNGDGFGDVLVTRSGAAGTVEVHLGGALGLSLTPAASLASPTEDPVVARSFGISAVCAGDVNGDGFADVAVAEMTGGLVSPWNVHLFFGGENGPAAKASVTILAPAYAGARGAQLAAAGDVNGDGFDDLLVGSPETLVGIPTTQPALTRAVLYFGSLVGPSTIGLQPFVLPALVSDFGGTFGDTVGGIGDFDGDGFADIMLGVAQTMTPSYPGVTAFNFAYVHKGSPLGAWAAPTFTLASAQSDTTFGRGVARGF